MKRRDNEKTLFLGKEREVLADNLSMMISAGMPLIAALRALRDETATKRAKKVLDKIIIDVDDGSPLWRAVDGVGLFSAYGVSLIRLGEQSGSLGKNLKAIALQEEKDRSFRSKIGSAMLYPVFVLLLTLVVGLSIAWFVLPRLSTVFSRMNVKLPLVTRLLIDFGTFLQNYGFIFIPLIIVFFGIVAYFLFFFPKTKFIGQAFLLKLPGISKLIKEIELARFGYLLGSLLEAGLPITQALEALEQTATFVKYKNFYAALNKKINDGYSFKKSFSSYKSLNNLMPSSVQQMVVSAEQSSNLDKSLTRIGQSFEAKTDNTAKNFIVILEPFLLVIVWLGVLGVALAVILPIYSLIGNFNQ